MKENQHKEIRDLVRRIPKGRVSTYGAIANYLGISPRTVGWALNKSFQPGAEAIPAHRVVNRLGLLSGKHHFGDAFTMQNLLEDEGVIVKDDLVQDFKTRLWDPIFELA